VPSPIDRVRAFHNAFRRDMADIDAAGLAAAGGKPGFEPTAERFRFFNEVLEWHAHGEELAMFPALEDVERLVAEAYGQDDRGLVPEAFPAAVQHVRQAMGDDLAELSRRIPDLAA
jgi:hemerythrin HHE cation binding domain-containing protein